MRILVILENMEDRDVIEAVFTLLTEFAGPTEVSISLLAFAESREAREQAEDEFARAIETLPAHLRSMEVEVRTGHPVRAAFHRIASSDFDLLILGTHHDPLKAKYTARTFAQQVLSRSCCPTIIVREHASPIRRILVCESGAGAESELRHFLPKLDDVLGTKAEVVVLHVMSQMSAGPGVKGWQLRAGAEEIIRERTPEGTVLGQDIDILREAYDRAVPKVRHGLVVDEIVAEARSGDYDLVVIGGHERRGWKKLILENLAGEIVERLRAPVLVVPQE